VLKLKYAISHIYSNVVDWFTDNLHKKFLLLCVSEREHGKITHSWDMWHGAKNLGKKLFAVSCE